MTHKTTELYMDTEQIFWLYKTLEDYWAVGAWWDTGVTGPDDDDIREISLARIWIATTREAYDEIHGDGATQARYEELMEIYKARSAKYHEQPVGKEMK